MQADFWRSQVRSFQIFQRELSKPNIPKFDGEETFPGLIIHSHDFKNGQQFKDQRVLCIGGSYSAEDICLNCWKSGASTSHVSIRRQGGFGYPDWPDSVEEKPKILKISQEKF